MPDTQQLIDALSSLGGVKAVLENLEGSQSRIFDSHPTVILHSVKVACVGYACQDIGLLLQRGRLSDKTLARLQEVLSQTIPADILERIFLAERVYQTEIGRNLIPANITSQFLQDKAPDLPERLSLPTSYWGQLRLRRKAVWFFRNMAQLIAAAHRPWPEPLGVIVDNAPESMKKTRELFSNAAACVYLTGEIIAYVRCTTLAVALERYRRSNRQLPDSLGNLSPNYIDSVPPDPFTGKKLLYNHDAESYIVYSVGVNRQDDDGAVIRLAGKKTRQDCGLRIQFREPQ